MLEPEQKGYVLVLACTPREAKQEAAGSCGRKNRG